MTDDEAARVRAEGFKQNGAFEQRDRTLFILQDRTGYRIVEMLSLRVADVLAAGRVPAGPVNPDMIVDRLAIQPRHMKRNEPRSPVKLHPEAREALAGWLETMRERGVLAPATPVFYSRKRLIRAKDHPLLPFAEAADAADDQGEFRPITPEQALHIYKVAFRRCGIYGQTGTHSLRKRFAVRTFRNSGNNMRLVQRALGHRNIASTEAYLPVDQDEVDAAVVGGI